MKPRPLAKSLLTACTLAALTAGPLSAEDKADKDDKGWIKLFNGKDFTGWKISDTKESKIAVEDGMIVCQGPRSHAFTKADDFKNFHFKAEVKTTKGSNSGIYFHTKYQDTGWPAVGHESQVNVTHKDPVKTGSIYNTVKLFKTPAKDGEWWTQEIIVKGKHVVIKINGETVVDYTEPAGKTGPVKLGRGSFALQAHDPNSVVYYRNLMVKRLGDDAK